VNYTSDMKYSPYYLKTCRYKPSFFCLFIEFLGFCVKISCPRVITETLWHLSLSLVAETSCQGWWESVACICLVTLLRSHPLACTLSLDRDKTALKDSKGKSNPVRGHYMATLFSPDCHLLMLR